MPLFRTALVVDDEPSMRHVLTLLLTGIGMDVRAASDGKEALAELQARAFDVVLSDLKMPHIDGLTLLTHAKAMHPQVTFVVMSAYGSKELALKAVASGAYDFIEKPFKPEEAVFVLRKAEERMRLVRENERLRGTPSSTLIGDSSAMVDLRQKLQRVARAPSTVLLTGESGTGKELAARSIHAASDRANGPFVAVNCGAIPAGLVESELFGHAKGAFTDAHQARQGVFAEADGGTLFLDEVAELPPSAQVKLLRVLQDGEVRPVGESKSERVDVRVVAATLKDLGALAARGEFREDLYFRLGVVVLSVPPLRERAGDIAQLAHIFVERFNRVFNRAPRIAPPSPEIIDILNGYRWPGNVRELENAIEHAVVFTEGEELRIEAFPARLWTAQPAQALPAPELAQFSLKRAREQLEETFIRAALKHTRGNRRMAAELLELSQRALHYKIKEYGIDA